MRFTIFKKLLISMLIISIVPLITLGYFSLLDERGLGQSVIDEVQVMEQYIISDSIVSLKELGEKIIDQKAIDVAKQLEIYIKNNPQMTIKDLQEDEFFQKIAVQPVGKTGYTAITDVDSLVCRFHANSSTINLDLHNLADTLPGFWKIMFESKNGKDSKGYYGWEESDGRVEDKYMYIAIVDAKTADDVKLSVAVTTYINEFSQPANVTKEKINKTIRETTLNMKTATEGATSENTIFTITLITSIFVVGVSYLLARRISRPINELKKAADKITSGEFDFKLPKVKGKDEIVELTSSMEMLIQAYKTKIEKKK